MLAIQPNIVANALKKTEELGEKNNVKIDKAPEIPATKEHQK